ncbi:MULTISPECIES: DUF7535 family protein [Halorussus]|uniref:DUF7535 family protein n=1 Tax=Halorussus TaxID=1070314 RepID=UPI00209D6355|nr:hypothetical protein [Halorussus vallis]USZ75028.1 hypothetical protein NGM07_16510 [Halorussus vallis]
MSHQVSRYSGFRSNSEMGIIGYIVAAGVMIVMLPVLPFLAVLWLLRKLGGGQPSPA